MKWTFAVILGLGTSLSPLGAGARPMYYNQLLEQYPGNKLNAFKCMTCHIQGHALNPFGKDFYSKVKNEHPLNFHKIDGLDSDGDGISNRDEIMQGTNPGVPN